ncbi:hypothetical protein GCM10011586_25710 [Silvibacterium dinghuense]|nr:hypothetical protein GCM10011586_25710 [Silvibacterium dinghuense]
MPERGSATGPAADQALFRKKDGSTPGGKNLHRNDRGHRPGRSPALARLHGGDAAVLAALG